jgi:hypothetical protein
VSRRMPGAETAAFRVIMEVLREWRNWQTHQT